MSNMLIREKLIRFACMGVFTPRQMGIIAKWLSIDSDLSIYQILHMKGEDRFKNVYELSERVQLLEKTQNFDKIMQQCRDNHIFFCTIVDEDYPPGLKEIYLPPIVLFYQGNWRLTKRRRLGIVGSRKQTAYGEKVLSGLLPSLISKHVTTVSGLAAGIDTTVHAKTMVLGGSTIAVIGTGLDKCYPIENSELQQKIGRNHLVISEYPLGTKPDRHHFPMRNRIIAGLSHGTLVVEAKQRSGSLITANVALQENREVFAVPGDILNPAFRGTNELIRAGAKMVLDSEDIFEEMQAIWLLK